MASVICAEERAARRRQGQEKEGSGTRGGFPFASVAAMIVRKS